MFSWRGGGSPGSGASDGSTPKKKKRRLPSPRKLFKNVGNLIGGRGGVPESNESDESSAREMAQKLNKGHVTGRDDESEVVIDAMPTSPDTIFEEEEEREEEEEEEEEDIAELAADGNEGEDAVENVSGESSATAADVATTVVPGFPTSAFEFMSTRSEEDASLAEADRADIDEAGSKPSSARDLIASFEESSNPSDDAPTFTAAVAVKKIPPSEPTASNLRNRDNSFDVSGPVTPRKVSPRTDHLEEDLEPEPESDSKGFEVVFSEVLAVVSVLLVLAAVLSVPGVVPAVSASVAGLYALPSAGLKTAGRLATAFSARMRVLRKMSSREVLQSVSDTFSMLRSWAPGAAVNASKKALAVLFNVLTSTGAAFAEIARMIRRAVLVELATELKDLLSTVESGARMIATAAAQGSYSGAIRLLALPGEVFKQVCAGVRALAAAAPSGMQTWFPLLMLPHAMYAAYVLASHDGRDRLGSARPLALTLVSACLMLATFLSLPGQLMQASTGARTLFAYISSALPEGMKHWPWFLALLTPHISYVMYVVVSRMRQKDSAFENEVSVPSVLAEERLRSPTSASSFSDGVTPGEQVESASASAATADDEPSKASLKESRSFGPGVPGVTASEFYSTTARAAGSPEVFDAPPSSELDMGESPAEAMGAAPLETSVPSRIVPMTTHGITLESFAGKYPAMISFDPEEVIMSGNAHVARGEFTSAKVNIVALANPTRMLNQHNLEEVFMALSPRGLFIFKPDKLDLIQVLLLTNYTFSSKSGSSVAVLEAKHNKGYYSHDMIVGSAGELESWMAAIDEMMVAQRGGPWVADAKAREIRLTQDLNDMVAKLIEKEALLEDIKADADAKLIEKDEKISEISMTQKHTEDAIADLELTISAKDEELSRVKQESERMIQDRDEVLATEAASKATLDESLKTIQTDLDSKMLELEDLQRQLDEMKEGESRGQTVGVGTGAVPIPVPVVVDSSTTTTGAVPGAGTEESVIVAAPPTGTFDSPVSFRNAPPIVEITDPIEGGVEGVVDDVEGPASVARNLSSSPIVTPNSRRTSHGIRLSSYAGSYDAMVVFDPDEVVASGRARILRNEFTSTSSAIPGIPGVPGLHLPKLGGRDKEDVFLALSPRGLFIFKANKLDLVQLLLLTNYTFASKRSTKGSALEATRSKGYYSHDIFFEDDEAGEAWATAVNNLTAVVEDGPWAVEAKAREMKLVEELTELRKYLATRDGVSTDADTKSTTPREERTSHGIELTSYGGKYSGKVTFDPDEVVASETAHIRKNEFTSKRGVVPTIPIPMQDDREEVFLALTARGFFIFKSNKLDLIQLLLLTNYDFVSKTSKYGDPTIEAQHHRGYYCHEIYCPGEDELQGWLSVISSTVDQQKNGAWAPEAKAREEMLMREIDALKEQLHGDPSSTRTVGQSEEEIGSDDAVVDTTASSTETDPIVTEPEDGVDDTTDEQRELEEKLRSTSMEIEDLKRQLSGATEEKEEEDKAGTGAVVAPLPLAAPVVVSTQKDENFVNNVDGAVPAITAAGEDETEGACTDLIAAVPMPAANEEENVRATDDTLPDDDIGMLVEYGVPSADCEDQGALVADEEEPDVDAEETAAEEKGVAAEEEGRTAFIPPIIPAPVVVTQNTHTSEAASAIPAPPEGAVVDEEIAVDGGDDVVDAPDSILNETTEGDDTEVDIGDDAARETDALLEGEEDDAVSADELITPKLESEDQVFDKGYDGDDDGGESVSVDTPREALMPVGEATVVPGSAVSAYSSSYMMESAMRFGLLSLIARPEFKDVMLKGENKNAPNEPTDIIVGSFLGGALGMLVGKTVGVSVGIAVDSAISFSLNLVVSSCVTAAAVLNAIASSSKFLEDLFNLIGNTPLGEV